MQEVNISGVSKGYPHVISEIQPDQPQFHPLNSKLKNAK